MAQINWIRFTVILAARIIKEAIVPLNSEKRINVLTVDDSMFEHNRSKKVELLAKVYDHAKHSYKFGFRMLTFGWSDGSAFLPVNGVLLSSENRKNRINDTRTADKRTVGYKRRQLSMEKGAIAMLELLKAAKKRPKCSSVTAIQICPWLPSITGTRKNGADQGTCFLSCPML